MINALGRGRAVAQVVSRWSLSLRRTEFTPGSVHVGFVVDKVALRQVSIRVLRFTLNLKITVLSFNDVTPWGTILVEEPILGYAQLVRKYHLLWNRKFITMFTGAHHQSLS
jgi:hypothetical protein